MVFRVPSCVFFLYNRRLVCSSVYFAVQMITISPAVEVQQYVLVEAHILTSLSRRPVYSSYKCKKPGIINRQRDSSADGKHCSKLASVHT
jgi:hypothetical protein